MIDIALLGGVSVSVEGGQLSGEAAQRRRVALLALLSAPALRPVSRDRLIGWLWPDHDPDSARHLLSAALHVLRKALGADALLTTGDDVALNPERVQVDVAAFRAALAAGDVERALAAYAGDFMDGFFVNDAGEFAQWVDGEREELRRLYGGALEQAAGERAAAGNVAGAAEAWRRRAALDPYDARVAVALMQALAAAGQRGAAIQHARLHAQLLEQEFGAEPDPQVERLAAALRQAPPDSGRPPTAAESAKAMEASPRGAAIPTFTESPPPPGPAEVSAGSAADPPLANAEAPPTEPSQPEARGPARPTSRTRGLQIAAAVAVVAVCLLGWQFYRVWWPMADEEPLVAVRSFVSRDPALAGMGRAISEEVYRLLREYEGLRLAPLDVGFAMDTVESRRALTLLNAGQRGVVLDANLWTASGKFHALTELSNRRGRNVWSEDVQGLTIRELELQLVRGAAKKLRLTRRSGAPAGEFAGTLSDSARGHYLRGRTAWLSRTPDSLRAALREYLAATVIDPNYARAWAGLADAYNMLGSYDYAGLAPDSAYPRAEQAAAKALALDSTLSDAWAARANTAANYHWDWESARRYYQKALERAHGQHTSATEWYALLLATRGSFVEAERLMRDAVEQQPNVALTWLNNAHVLYYARKYAAAREAAELAARLDPHFPPAYFLQAMIALNDGRRDAALQILRPMWAAAGTPEPPLTALLAYAEAVNGATSDAGLRLNALNHERARRYVPPELFALVYTALGKRDEAFAELDRAFREHGSGLMYLPVEPLIDSLRTDPRYPELLARIKPR